LEHAPLILVEQVYSGSGRIKDCGRATVFATAVESEPKVQAPAPPSKKNLAPAPALQNRLGCSSTALVFVALLSEQGRGSPTMLANVSSMLQCSART